MFSVDLRLLLLLISHMTHSDIVHIVTAITSQLSMVWENVKTNKAGQTESYVVAAERGIEREEHRERRTSLHDGSPRCH